MVDSTAGGTAETAREQIVRGMNTRIWQSVRRRTPFMSDTAAKELSEDITENLMSFFREVFEL